MIGTFGQVYKAVHKLTQDQRAVKIISKANVSHEKEVKLMQEMNILKELVNLKTHP